MKTNKWLLLFAILTISITFTGCSNDEPEFEEGEYVDTEIPGFYETRTEITPYTFCFSFGGNQYSLHGPYSSALDEYHDIFYDVDIVYYDFLYTLQKLDSDIENCTFEDYRIVPRFYIIDNIQNEIGENFLGKYSFIFDNCPDDIHFAPYCINGAAFDGCNKLKSISISGRSPITGVNKIAFRGCDNLTDIYVYGNKLPFVESKKFALDYEKVTLHVPENLDDSEFNEYPWKRFKNIERDLPRVR